MERITKEELLEMLFHDDYEHLKGKKLRMTRVRVPGKEVCLAHVISHEECRCTDRVYGSFLRFSDHYRRIVPGADCCGRGRTFL